MMMEKDSLAPVANTFINGTSVFYTSGMRKGTLLPSRVFKLVGLIQNNCSLSLCIKTTVKRCSTEFSRLNVENYRNRRE